jgi:hypothetical protein
VVHSPADSAFLSHLQMTSPNRVEVLFNAVGDVNEVVATVAIALSEATRFRIGGRRLRPEQESQLFDSRLAGAKFT